MTILFFCQATFRYEVEFLPTLVLLAVVGILGLERILAPTPKSGQAPTLESGQAGRPVWRRAVRWGWGLLLGFSVAFNLLAGVEHYADTHCYIGDGLFLAGKIQDAMEHYEQALRIIPDHARAHNNLGCALEQVGRLTEAIGQYEQALQVKPDYTEAHSNLGTALARQGRVAEEIAEFAAALRIKPDSAETHHNLGIVLARQGRISETIAQYREALRLRPNWPPVLSKLAWILATNQNADFRNAGEAVRLAEGLCTVTKYQQADALDVLAAAYAEAGRFSDAIRIAQKAVELAGAAGQQELAQQVQERLKLYQAGQPFHEGS